MSSVFVYVQHLLGIGHLKRVALLCRGLTAERLEVDMISGGMPVLGLDTGGARVFQLPSLKSGAGGFHDLVGGDDRPVDDAWKARRRDHLLNLSHQRRYDALIIEAFPFGRRQMRFELLPLLAAARARTPRPLTICSVRDIVQAKRDPAHIAETAELTETSFDHVLVHGDLAFVRFEETFPEARRFAAKLHYTGIIAGAGAPRGGRGAAGRGEAGRGEVLVSAGGGAVGEKLLATAMDSRPLTSVRDSRWRLLAGPNLGARALAGLAARAPAGVVVERHRRDFPALLARCAVSVSQAGYNTVADFLRAQSRAVIVPYAAHGETEQSLRARRLAERGLAQVVTEDTLSPKTLAGAIDAAFQATPADAARPDLDGARAGARLVRGWLTDRGAGGRRVPKTDPSPDIS